MSCEFTLDDGSTVLIPFACEMTNWGKVTHTFAYTIHGPGDFDWPLLKPKMKKAVSKDEKKQDTDKDGWITVTTEFGQEVKCIPCGLVDWSTMGTSSSSDPDGKKLNELWDQFEADVAAGVPKVVTGEITVTSRTTFAFPVMKCKGCTVNFLNSLNPQLGLYTGDTQDVLVTVTSHLFTRNHLNSLLPVEAAHRANWLASVTWWMGGITPPGYRPRDTYSVGNQQ